MAQRSRSAPAAFAAGFCFALVVCSGVIAQRVSHGTLAIAIIAQLVMTGAAVCVATSARAGDFRLFVHALGGIVGILVAHAMLEGSALRDSSGLCERPAQLVNDAIAVLAPLAIVWASSRRPPSTWALAATLLAVTAYHATGESWHLDPGQFQHSVQDLVTAQLGASTVGVTALRLVSRG